MDFRKSQQTHKPRERTDISTPTRTRHKKPDDQISLPAPHLLPGHTGQRPTMVIESGYSESRARLAADVRWWLAESQADVAIAITICVCKTRREIAIDLWGDSGSSNPSRPSQKDFCSRISSRSFVGRGGETTPQPQQRVNMAGGGAGGGPPFDDLIPGLVFWCSANRTREA